MFVRVEAELALGEPSVDEGYIVWFAGVVMDRDDEGEPGAEMGRVRLALIHTGDAGGDLYDALDADSGDLEALFGMYFEDGGLKEKYCEGIGESVLYFDSIELHEPWRGKDIELAVARRLIDALGHGCAIVVMPFQAPDRTKWERMGFVETAPPGETGWGHMHLSQAFTQPRVTGPDEEGRVRVLPNLTDDERRRHH